MLEKMENINFDIAFSKRSTIGISVLPTLVVKIRAPTRITGSKLEAIILSKKDWILKKLDEFKTHSKQMKTETQTFILGQKLNIVITKGKSKIEGDSLILSNSKNALKSFLKQKALEVFTERLEICFTTFNQNYDFEIPNLVLRCSKNRLGSMMHKIGTKKGLMMLNINLVHLDLEFIDYVIFHELCHLKYKGHGVRFHNLQEGFVPNWKELKKEISYILLK